MATYTDIRSAAFLAVALTALLTVSCEKEDGGLPVSADACRAGLTLVVSAPQTRSAVTPHESDVVTLDLLAFRASDGLLDASARVSGGADRVSAEVSAGVPLRWKVVANAPAGAFGSVTSESAFDSALTSLTDGGPSSLVMWSAGELTVTEGQGPVSAPLSRYACKVSVESLEVRWLDTFTVPPAVTLERAVLVNVVGTAPYSGVPQAGGVWYNRMGVDPDLPADVGDMTVAEYGSVRVASSGALSVASPLYCMPNPVSNNDNSANAPEWTPRSTRVALELLVDGVPNWYPVDLPSMECNRHYVIRRLVIDGPGSQGPDFPVTREDLSFTVEVVPWTDEAVELPAFGD